MLKIILLLIIVATFDWHQVRAGQYVKNVHISVSDASKILKINMKLRRISSSRLVTFYLIFSLNGECIRQIIFRCSKCKKSNGSMMLSEKCPRKFVIYNSKKRSIRYWGRDNKLKCGQYSISILSHNGRGLRFEAFKNLVLKSSCSRIRNLRISSTRSDCKTAKIKIHFNPPVSNSKSPVLKYRVTIKSKINSSCVLTTTFNCRDCSDRTALLPDSDSELNGCFNLKNKLTFSKNQTAIVLEIDNPRITMATVYTVIIQPATQCSKCLSSYFHLRTISIHACYAIRNVRMSSTRKDCKTAKIKIYFRPPFKNSKRLVLKYRVTIKLINSKSCVLTTTFNCRDCSDRTHLLPDTDTKLKGCYKLRNNVTFSKNQKLILFEIDYPRITMATRYIVIIEPATKCSKCSSTYKYLTTISRHACSTVQRLTVSSSYLTCKTAKLHISFSPPRTNSGQPVLRYIIIVKNYNRRICIMTASLDCRDCFDRTQLLMKESLNTHGCQYISSHLTYNKHQRTISVELRSSRIKMSTHYRIIVEPVTKCKRCKSISKLIYTVRKYSYPNQCRKSKVVYYRYCYRKRYLKTVWQTYKIAYRQAYGRHCKKFLWVIRHACHTCYRTAYRIARRKIRVPAWKTVCERRSRTVYYWI